MFVSIVLDPGSELRAKELTDLLRQYGFEKIQRGVWESGSIAQATLDRVKHDLDRATDAYDRIRIFQFPVDGTLVVSALKDKKWRRLTAKPPAQAPAKATAKTPAKPPARPLQKAPAKAASRTTAKPATKSR
jgi:CRISPR-associated protein Cas2